MTKGVDLNIFRAALSKIDDGNVFENFAKQFLSNILGYDFIPVGGVKDRGIDGLESILKRKDQERSIYQISIQKTYEDKIRESIRKLVRNNIALDRFYYVTNQDVKNKDLIQDEMYEEFQLPTTIYDINWFAVNVNSKISTVNTYKTFIDTYLHEFEKPGKSYVVSDLVGDPRLFVFLRQQWDSQKDVNNIDEILCDTLILYALENTDPDKSELLTSTEIKSRIAKTIKFDPKVLHDLIDKRLQELSKKPRKIHFHPDGGYCLPYETRIAIAERNIEEENLHKKFVIDTEEKIKKYINPGKSAIKDCTKLVETVVHDIFYKQGLEFSQFVQDGQSQDSLENDISTIISDIVDRSKVAPRQKQDIKLAMQMAVRDMVYNGTEAQKIYLKKLSNTYMMLFMLQCDPKIATYFESMAAKLFVYVDTSIIIPALSEYYLSPENKRYWGLLKGAHDAGVKLVINAAILQELVAHFNAIIVGYEKEYKYYENSENLEDLMLLVDTVLMRSYFYAKHRDQVSSFESFIENFVNYDLSNAAECLVEWLKSEFGIVYVDDKSLNVSVDQSDYDRLFSVLSRYKSHEEKAKSDAMLILHIYAMRSKNNEMGDSGIVGYKTWWLSTDTRTHRSVIATFRNKYKVSCYLRPDFLLNYISLAPNMNQVDHAYKDIFPSFLGVNISFHMPKEIINCVRKYVNDHRNKNEGRIKAILRDLADKLKTDPSYITRARVESYLEKAFASKEN